MAVLLTRKAVVRAAMESSYDVAASLGLNDGLLVDKPQFKIKPNVLERNFVRNDLSPMPHIIGRKIASVEFETELRGNGVRNSGVTTDAPIIARLFRACGYALTGHAQSSLSTVFAVGDEDTPVTWAGDASMATNTDMIAYYVTVDTPGASGVAHITITSDTQGEGSASAAVTSGTPIPLGAKGATVTPTWTGSLKAGQQWVVWLRPPGLSLDPISDNFESVTIDLHKDGVKHLVPGCYGTFQITAQAGNFATVKWDFTGCKCRF
jgi:hypothetical protein